MRKFTITEIDEGWRITEEGKPGSVIAATGIDARANLMRESAIRAESCGMDAISITWSPVTRTGRCVVTVLTSRKETGR